MRSGGGGLNTCKFALPLHRSCDAPGAFLLRSMPKTAQQILMRHQGQTCWRARITFSTPATLTLASACILQGRSRQRVQLPHISLSCLDQERTCLIIHFATLNFLERVTWSTAEMRRLFLIALALPALSPVLWLSWVTWWALHNLKARRLKTATHQALLVQRHFRCFTCNNEYLSSCNGRSWL